MSWRNYISLEKPFYFGKDEGFNLTGQLRQDIESSLDEMYSTPEGRELIEQAVANSPGNHLFIIGNDNLAGTGWYSDESVFFFSTVDGKLQYSSPETESYQPFTTQRILFHELYHSANGHLGFPRPSPSEHLQNEAETVQAANLYMRKYYGEPYRGDYLDTNHDGSRQWNFNPNFREDLTSSLENERYIQTASDIRGNFGVASVAAEELQQVTNIEANIVNDGAQPQKIQGLTRAVA